MSPYSNHLRKKGRLFGLYSASLDGARREEVLPYLVRVCNELRIPALYVSHAMAEVTRIADTLVLVSGGRVVAAGPVDEVIARPDLFPLTGRHEAGAVLDTTVDSHDEDYGLSELRCAAGIIAVPRVQLPVGQSLRVRIRARDVVVALASDDALQASEPPRNLSTQTALRATVVSANEREDSIVDLMLDCAGSPLVARVTRRSVDVLGLTAGRPVWALVKSVSFDRRTLGITPAVHETRPAS
ncbi:MAG: TOBE domain-containing protein [Gammaproteobacteria bacterium]